MNHWLRNILILTLWTGCKGQDEVTQTGGDVTATEGDSVTLSCTYKTSYTGSTTLFWYKQDGNNKPKFILSVLTAGEGNKGDEFRDRFSSILNSSSKSAPLEIQKLQLSDSAVYYCAPLLDDGTQKMIFGSGTRLNVGTREVTQPSYYVLENEDTTVCLSTGFSRYNAIWSKPLKQSPASTASPALQTTVDPNGPKGLFENTEAVRIEDTPFFSQVALISGNQKERCAGDSGGSGSCSRTMEPDPMVNLASLITMGLRILFIKTIIFNVLMTLRLWISL